MKLFLYIGIFLALGCNSSKKASLSESPKGPHSEEIVQETSIDLGITDSIFLFQERTICYGECPSYTITVYPKGKVVYVGKEFVERKGRFESHISMGKMKEILDEAKRIHYFEMQDVYDAYVTDIPSCISIISAEGQRKKILNRAEAPEELIQFQRFLDRELLELDWKSVDR